LSAGSSNQHYDQRAEECGKRYPEVAHIVSGLDATNHRGAEGRGGERERENETNPSPAILGCSWAISFHAQISANNSFDEMIVHLIDGTYELFRHFYGQRRFNQGKDKPFGAVAGVLHSVLEMFETGATHIGVATDHVIESFRNDLWPDYKTGEGIEPALYAQFLPLEVALAAMGVAVWPMTDLEADDGLASAAHLGAEDSRVEKVCIWANDKDLAQCVRDDRVVQIIRKGMQVRNAEGVRAKFGVEPALIPDFLALVGDAQDGYPGILGIGQVTAAALLNRHGPIESFPEGVLGDQRERAMLFKTLATLRTDAPLFADVNELEWKGPTPAFAEWPQRMGDNRIEARVAKVDAARER